MQSRSPSADELEPPRTLYRAVLEDEGRFEEFKRLLAQYPPQMNGDRESLRAAAARARLNTRVRAWTGARFEGLSAAQVSLWRAILLDIPSPDPPWLDLSNAS